MAVQCSHVAPSGADLLLIGEDIVRWWRILLEAAPAGLDPATTRTAGPTVPTTRGNR
jgi:hypothetical protein